MQKIRFGFKEFFYVLAVVGVVLIVSRFKGPEIVLTLVFVFAGLFEIFRRMLTSKNNSMQQIRFGLKEILYVVTLAAVASFVTRFEGGEMILLLALLFAGLLIAVLRGNARMRQEERTDSGRPE